jgi:hypothetical protein
MYSGLGRAWLMAQMARVYFWMARQSMQKVDVADTQRKS